jgi:hypothetical protein
MKQNFWLFVSQTEAKIMRNRLRFASISHEAKKNSSEKGTPYPGAAFPGEYVFCGFLFRTGFPGENVLSGFSGAPAETRTTLEQPH